jgi:hypothetical protein
MMRLCLIALLSTSLAACQATSSVPQADGNSSSALAARTLGVTGYPALGPDCGEYTAVFEHQDGGKIALPEADYSYAGKVYYASGNFGDGLAEFYGCPGSDDSLGIPVPNGYTPDWFGQIRFGFSTAFGQGDLIGKMYSTLWLPKTDYFMYIYDENNNLIESYKIGRANVKSENLTFPSPFENRFTVTEGTSVNFEIAHKTK